MIVTDCNFSQVISSSIVIHLVKIYFLSDASWIVESDPFVFYDVIRNPFFWNILFLDATAYQVTNLKSIEKNETK